MSKAFTREGDAPDEEIEVEPQVPQGSKNYITPAGYARLRSELRVLDEVERPELAKTVASAASNGTRSENADYLYGKKRLREIERRIRFLMKRLEIAEVVDPRDQGEERVFFGATVAYRDAGGREHTVSIVGTDEVDPGRGRVSWVSPIARALLKAREGDAAVLPSPRLRGEGQGEGLLQFQSARLGPEGLAARFAKSPALTTESFPGSI